MNRIEVNGMWCKKCGICVGFCPVKVFTEQADGSPVPTYREKCTGCRMCVLRCPDFALEVEVGKSEGK